MTVYVTCIVHTHEEKVKDKKGNGKEKINIEKLKNE